MDIRVFFSRRFTKYMVFLFAVMAAPSSFAISSMCFDFYSGGTRYMAHSMSYSYSESDQAEESDLGHQMIISSPSYYLHQVTTPTSFGGGWHQTQRAAVASGNYSWSGQGFTGQFVNPNFYVAHQSVPCSGSFTITPPRPSAYITISPPIVDVGDSVVIDWGTDGIDCHYLGMSIGPSGPYPFNAALTDAGTYTITCVNAAGVWSLPASDSLVVNDPGPSCPAVPVGVNSMTYPVVDGTSPPSDAIGYFSRSGNPTVGSEAYCTATEWRLKVVSAQHTVRIDVNLSNMGNAQIDSEVINDANCAVLETMRSSLVSKAASVTSSYGGWYDSGAVEAHEHIHRERYETSVNSLFSVAKSGIEAISIPLAAASNQADAYAQLTGTSTSYNGILVNLNSESFTAYSLLGHGSPSDFITAQQNAIVSFISQIDLRLTTCP